MFTFIGRISSRTWRHFSGRHLRQNTKKNSETTIPHLDAVHKRSTKCTDKKKTNVENMEAADEAHFVVVEAIMRMGRGDSLCV